MIIRPVREEDAASLQQNCFSANTFEQTAAMIPPAIDGLEHGESAMLVAEENGDVLGTCTVERLAHRMCRHRADIVGFVITPAAQGTGLARKLVDAANQRARDWGCSILEISCRGGTHAEDAYRSLGFRVWGRLPEGYRDRDQTFDEVLLWKPISPG
ncbi:GNAT family N-acetyltransferase [Actinopolymorpha sp. B9G3]|uniref:GNAT family N-acetyltransferase n=1 Tax=Actinopolymorpha sp. B9G3 TaxID=3158970 RepID=UPI0032D8B611